MTTPSVDQKANELQFGGAHYKGTTYQHWDMAADMKLGYFEGQITKYITRHRQKKGKEDVQKCGHFIQKLIELATEGRTYPRHTEDMAPAVRFVEGRPDLTPDELSVFWVAANWNGTAVLQIAKHICDSYAGEYALSPGEGLSM